MSDEQVHTPEEQKAQAAVQFLTEMPADPGFRHDLKMQFMSGQLAGEAGPVEAPVYSPVGEQVPFWKTAVRRMYPPLAVAGFLLLVVILNRVPGWEVVQTEGTGTVYINEQPVSVSDTEALDAAVISGARIRIPGDGGVLRMASKGNFVFELTPGSDVVLPANPGRWFARDVSGEVLAGEVRVNTGERFQGATLELTTPMAALRVVGTTFAVIQEPDFICVCVFEGTVELGREFEYMDRVPEGHRRVLYSDPDRSRLTTEIDARERMKLDMLNDQTRDLMELPDIEMPPLYPTPDSTLFRRR